MATPFIWILMMACHKMMLVFGTWPICEQLAACPL